MEKKQIVTSNAPATIGPYSQAVTVDNLIFVSGQLPVNPDTGLFVSDDIKELAKQSMDNISSILKEAGSSMEHILKTTIFLKDLNDFAAVNEVYSSYFSTTYPARSCVQVAELPKGAKLEIEAIAFK